MESIGATEIQSHFNSASLLTIRAASQHGGIIDSSNFSSNSELQNIVVFPSIANTSRSLSSLSESTELLKNVDIVCLPPPLLAFRNFISANPQLQRISIALLQGERALKEYWNLKLSDESISLPYVASLTTCLGALPNLESVKFRTLQKNTRSEPVRSPIIANSCVPFPCRAMYLEVNDFIYLLVGGMLDRARRPKPKPKATRYFGNFAGVLKLSY